MIKTTACLSLLSSLLLSLSGCGKSKAISSNYQDSTTYFTHGSPMALIAGATTATDGLLPASDVALYADFHLMTNLAFVEKSPQSSVSSIQEVEDENRTDGEGGNTSNRPVPIYRFRNAAAGRVEWASINDDRSPIFGFDGTGTDLKLIDIDGQPIEVLHYSLKNDHKAFSILVKHTQKNSGITLTSYTFGSTDTVNDPLEATSDFQFIHGSEKIIWDTLPTVDFCGASSSLVTATIQKSVKAWGSDPMAGNSPLPISFRTPSVFPPFSDLNTHCIYVVSSFDASNSPVAKALAVTLPVVSLASRQILDSDVFLFADLIGMELSSGIESPTVMHEMGHFWGLGHDFRVQANGEALHDTIMGYSKGTEVITAWDFAAIRELYNAGFVVTP